MASVRGHRQEGEEKGMNRLFNMTMKRVIVAMMVATLIAAVTGHNEVMLLLLGGGGGISLTMTIYHVIEERLRS